MLIGGMSNATLRRVVEHGVGWTAGGAPPDAIREFAAKVRAAWTNVGRDGEPKIVALAYFALGDTEKDSRAYLLDYYEPLGEDMAQMVAGSALRTPQAIKGAIANFADLGVDELILDPTVSDPDQADRLADVAL